MKLHLVDGTYELFRMHFGAQQRSSPDGSEVGAVAGIIGSTLSLLQEPGVTHIAVAFDTVIQSFRNDLFEGYKTEEGVPAELLAQFPIAEQAMTAMGVTTWSMVEFEADDAMATAARRFGPQVEQVILISPDKDLAQCVDGARVVAYDRRKRTFMDEEGVIEKFGVRPASIPDYLALVGDSADGFPGLPGWGAKSTSTVLARYPHLEAIPLDAAHWDVPVRGSGRLAAALRQNLPDALLFRYLAQLRTDVPLAESLAGLEWVGAHREPFESLCDRLGLDNLRDRPHRWAAL